MKNIIGFMVLALILGSCANNSSRESSSIPPLEETDSNPIGYKTVSEALEDLKQNPSAEVRENQGWVIVNLNDQGQRQLWSFTPPNHPAHPSAVKREVVDENGEISIEMSVLCQSDKSSCDELVRQFMDLNEKIKRDMRNGT